MSSNHQKKVSFPLGQIVATANATRQLTQSQIQEGLKRHASGDWGDLDTQDAQENERAVRQGGRIFSAYGSGQQRFWIITEADRSVTTVLLPLDY